MLWHEPQLASTCARPEPSLSSMRRSWAATMPAASASAMTSGRVFIGAPSDSCDLDPLHHVVVIAGGIRNQLGGLRGAGAIGCTRHDDHRTRRRWRDGETEAAKRKTPEVRAKRGVAPRAPAVGGDVHLRDAATAVPGDPLHLERTSHGHLLAAGETGDERIHHHFRDRLVDIGHLRNKAVDDRKLAERNAVGSLDPEAVEGLGDRIDRADVLHPIGAGPPGNDYSHREAVPVR